MSDRRPVFTVASWDDIWMVPKGVLFWVGDVPGVPRLVSNTVTSTDSTLWVIATCKNCGNEFERLRTSRRKLCPDCRR